MTNNGSIIGRIVATLPSGHKNTFFVQGVPQGSGHQPSGAAGGVLPMTPAPTSPRPATMRAAEVWGFAAVIDGGRS
jgi:hypothetical protein